MKDVRRVTCAVFVSTLLASAGIAAQYHYSTPMLYSDNPAEGMNQWDGSDWSGTPLPFSLNNVMYLGGAVMDQSNPTVRFIWYGDWSAHSNTQRLLVQFIADLNNSRYWNTLHGWQATTQNSFAALFNGVFPGRVSGGLQYGGSINDSYSHGRVLSASAVGSIVDDAISNNAFSLTFDASLDTNAVYVVVPSPDVVDTTGFCGFHGVLFPFENGGAGIWKYAYAATAQTLGSGCNPANQFVSPNNDTIGDALANILAHEVAETLTDPNPFIFEGWSSLSFPGEIADHCNFRYGPTYRTANGAFANVRLGSHDYLLQELLANTAPQVCSLGPTDAN